MIEKITDNVYAEIGLRGCNHGFVVTREGVVMIDTPQMPTDAVKWRDEIAKHGTVRYVINTEPHGDHFAGNHFFQGTVVAHEGTRDAILASSAEQFKQRLQETAPDCLPLMAGFSYRPPTITLSQRLTLHLGNHTFQLINLPGHTPFQVAVFIPEERVVFTSDNIFHKVQTWLQQAVPYQWLESLKRMQAMEADVLVPGHGSLCDRGYIPEMSRLIQAWIDAVLTAINQGMSLEEAQDKIPPVDHYPWDNDSMIPQIRQRNIASLYEALKK